MQIQSTTFPVEIFTGYYQISGEFTPRGNPAIFLNDPQVTAFTIENATTVPLIPGAHVGEMPYSPAYVQRSEIQLMILGDFTAQEAQLKPKPLTVKVFTDTYAIKATFYVGAETKFSDLFVGGPLFAATNADIYTVRPIAADIAGQVDLLYVNINQVRVYFDEE